MKTYTVYYDEFNPRDKQLKRYIDNNRIDISNEIYKSLSDYFETKPKKISCKLIAFDLINTIQKHKNKKVIEVYDIWVRDFENISIVINKQIEICIEHEEYELCAKYRDLLQKWNIYGKISGLINE